MGNGGIQTYYVPSVQITLIIEFICDFKWQASEFYVLPKILKCQSIISTINAQDTFVINLQDPLDLKGRPIVACCKSPIKNLSKMIELILKPLVKIQQTFQGIRVKF